MGDTYRYDEIVRIMDEAAPFYRLQISADGASTHATRHLNLAADEVRAIANLLRANDLYPVAPSPGRVEVEHPADITVSVPAGPRPTRLPITSGEHVKRLAEMAEAPKDWVTGRQHVAALAAWWSYCAGETDERPS